MTKAHTQLSQNVALKACYAMQLITILAIAGLQVVRNNRDNNFISDENRQKLYARDNYKCFYCNSLTNILSLDHIIPQSIEKNHAHNNLITACISCNSSKGNRSLEWFILRLNLTGKNTSITAKLVRRQASRLTQ